jgi:Fur family transcriptional regulator, ferric uptake regulator
VPVDVHAVAADRLSSVEQRYTSARRAIVDALVAAQRPLAIRDIVEDRRLPASTVYRNATILESAGVVRRVQGADDLVRFELAEDLTAHHHHLVCTSCGAVTDYMPSTALERRVERAIEAIASENGFQASSHRLDLVGVCSECN